MPAIHGRPACRPTSRHAQPPQLRVAVIPCRAGDARAGGPLPKHVELCAGVRADGGWWRGGEFKPALAAGGGRGVGEGVEEGAARVGAGLHAAVGRRAVGGAKADVGGWGPGEVVGDDGGREDLAGGLAGVHLEGGGGEGEGEEGEEGGGEMHFGNCLLVVCKRTLNALLVMR